MPFEQTTFSTTEAVSFKEKDFLWKRANKELKLLAKKLPSEFLGEEYFQNLHNVDKDILGCTDFAQIIKCYTKFTHSLGIKTVSLTSSPDTSHNVGLLPIVRMGNEDVYIELKKELSEKVYQTLLASLPILQQGFKRIFELRQNSVLIEMLKESLNLIEYPVCLFHNSDLEMQNKAYTLSGFTPRQSLENRHQQNINHQGNFYKVRYNDFHLMGDHFEVILYVPSDSLFNEDKSYRNEELGIVSSSIAHELNNPLAGILAGLDVLGLDDFDAETDELLEEMRGGVLRCKKLVETFLGFSKVQQHTKTQWIKVDELLFRSLELIRFRMVESNTHLHIVSDHKNREVSLQNISGMIMFFYLFFGEFLTSYSHNKLVNSQSTSDGLAVNVKITDDQLLISWKDRFSVGQTFLDSKLTKHLIKSEQMKLSHGESHFTISSFSTRDSLEEK